MRDHFRLQCGRTVVFLRSPNFARACGCVPVGGSPDKRPEKRQQCLGTLDGDFHRSGSSRTGSRRRKPAALPEAGDAAQSNDGAGFFRRGRTLQSPVELKRLVLLAGRAVEAIPPIEDGSVPRAFCLRAALSTAHLTASSRWHRVRTGRLRVSTMRGRVARPRLGSLWSGPSQAALGGNDDRPHSRLSPHPP
jgi:hypothetical protein